MAKESMGVNEPEEDLNTKPEARVNAPKITGAATERKRGGRAMRRRGGKLDGKKMMEVQGEHEKKRADRKPRKDGGRTGADQAPFSSARHGTAPPDHHTEMDHE